MHVIVRDVMDNPIVLYDSFYENFNHKWLSAVLNFHKDEIPTLRCIIYPKTRRGQDKTADFKWDKTADFENETKPPISKMRQNRRFRKWDKTADFKVGQNRRF